MQAFVVYTITSTMSIGLSLYLFTTASTMYIGSERPGLGLMSCDSAGLNKPL
jgi:hypothetical protein